MWPAQRAAYRRGTAVALCGSPIAPDSTAGPPLLLVPGQRPLPFVGGFGARSFWQPLFVAAAPQGGSPCVYV